MSFTKIAVTVPTVTFDAVEQARRRIGKSRSAMVALALDEWLKAQNTSEADRRYAEGYLRHPERPDLAFVDAATSQWEPWPADPAPRTRRPRRP